MREIEFGDVMVSFYHDGSLERIRIESTCLEYDWLPNGNINSICHVIRKENKWGGFHGELKIWDYDRKLIYHTYEVDDEEVHDFIECPLSDEERLLLVLKYGAPLLPRKDYERA